MGDGDGQDGRANNEHFVDDLVVAVRISKERKRNIVVVLLADYLKDQLIDLLPEFLLVLRWMTPICRL